MGNFNRVKNKQIEELNTKIEDQKKINDGLTFEMSRFVTEAN